MRRRRRRRCAAALPGPSSRMRPSPTSRWSRVRRERLPQPPTATTAGSSTRRRHERPHLHARIATAYSHPLGIPRRTWRTMTVEIGRPAPDFTLPLAGGGEVRLSALKGRKVIVYFYPKADTPGCTKESCGFNEALPDFGGARAEVIGISKDSVKKLEKFRDKYGLGFRLAS